MNNNTLLDNSNEELMMCNVLKKCISDDNFDEIMIATGYWDLPGVSEAERTAIQAQWLGLNK